jgi:hypothetical protein
VCLCSAGIPVDCMPVPKRVVVGIYQEFIALSVVYCILLNALFVNTLNIFKISDILKDLKQEILK